MIWRRRGKPEGQYTDSGSRLKHVLPQGSRTAEITPPVESIQPAINKWRMGLVVSASALCGGIAVVLWNRRLLTKMREVPPVSRSDRQGRLWDDDF